MCGFAFVLLNSLNFTGKNWNAFNGFGFSLSFLVVAINKVRTIFLCELILF